MKRSPFPFKTNPYVPQAEQSGYLLTVFPGPYSVEIPALSDASKQYHPDNRNKASSILERDYSGTSPDIVLLEIVKSIPAVYRSAEAAAKDLLKATSDLCVGGRFPCHHEVALFYRDHAKKMLAGGMLLDPVLDTLRYLHFKGWETFLAGQAGKIREARISWITKEAEKSDVLRILEMDRQDLARLVAQHSPILSKEMLRGLLSLERNTAGRIRRAIPEILENPSLSREGRHRAWKRMAWALEEIQKDQARSVAISREYRDYRPGNPEPQALSREISAFITAANRSNTKLPRGLAKRLLAHNRGTWGLELMGNPCWTPGDICRIVDTCRDHKGIGLAALSNPNRDRSVIAAAARADSSLPCRRRLLEIPGALNLPEVRAVVRSSRSGEILARLLAMDSPEAQDLAREMTSRSINETTFRTLAKMKESVSLSADVISDALTSPRKEAREAIMKALDHIKIQGEKDPHSGRSKDRGLA